MSKDSKLTLVKQQLAKTPNMKSETVAKHLGVSTAYAYNLMSTARKSLGMRKQPDGTWKLKERMQATPRDESAMKLLAVMSSDKPVTEESNSPRIVETHYDAKQTALDVQVGGEHYKKHTIQPVEFITKNNLGFLEGSIVKRICRWKDKGGIEDLNKIKHEIDLIIELNNLK